MGKQARIVLRVKPSPGGWLLTGRPGRIHGLYPLQAAAIYWGRHAGRMAWRRGRPAQLVVHGRDGKIRFESTYGRDPRHRKG